MSPCRCHRTCLPPKNRLLLRGPHKGGCSRHFGVSQLWPTHSPLVPSAARSFGRLTTHFMASSAVRQERSDHPAGIRTPQPGRITRHPAITQDRCDAGARPAGRAESPPAPVDYRCPHPSRRAPLSSGGEASHRGCRTIHVESDNTLQLGREMQIIGQLVQALPVWQQIVVTQCGPR